MPPTPVRLEPSPVIVVAFTAPPTVTSPDTPRLPVTVAPVDTASTLVAPPTVRTEGSAKPVRLLPSP